MSLESFIKKNKINNIYSYHQNDLGDNKVEYGWKNSDDLNLDEPIVLTYQSKSKKISDEDLRWSESEGKNAANLSCYLNYFFASTKMSPEDFLDKWGGNENELTKLNTSADTRGGEGLFMIDLARLLVNGGKMVRYGRIFKIINS